MEKYFYKSMKSLAAILIGATACLFTACTEDIDQSNRYTFTGQTIADYLEESPELYGSFCSVLKKAKLGNAESGNILNTLSTYGTYTCFAPTNEAFEIYLQEQYDAGFVSSPDVEALTIEQASQIAKDHLINARLVTADLSDGSMGMPTFSNRMLTLSTEQDPVSGKNIRTITATRGKYHTIIENDIALENGVIQALDGVLQPSNNTLDELVAEHPDLTLFAEALALTEVSKKLQAYELDPDYDYLQIEPQSMGTAYGLQNGLAPKTKVQKFTVLAESNEVLRSALTKAGYTPDIEGLKELANKWYGSDFYDQVDEEDYTSPDNPLNRFVSYHVIDRALIHDGGLGSFIQYGQTYKSQERFSSEKMFPQKYDRTDYFETLLEYSSIKITMPSENNKIDKTKIYANYSRRQAVNENMSDFINVQIQYSSSEESKTDQQEEKAIMSGKNGEIHLIDKVLIYNEKEMANNVLNERMRWDAASLFPELTNNGIRWAEQFDDSDANKHGCYIPNDYSSRLKVHNVDTKVFYIRPKDNVSAKGWSCYQGDEFLVDGTYDYEVRIPHVPEGTYEIRYGFSCSDARGICQFYFDNEICGIPVDMLAPRTDATMQLNEVDDKSVSDEKVATEEEKDAHDKTLRNRGWMRGPSSVVLEVDQNKGTLTMRNCVDSWRKIVITKKLEHGDHWIRFKDVTSSSSSGTGHRENSFDFLEIVPRAIYSSPTQPEDRN